MFSLHLASISAILTASGLQQLSLSAQQHRTCKHFPQNTE